MTKAKLFILGFEIELLWTDMHYYMETRMSGKPSSEIMGGTITVCFTSTSYCDLILNWMTKESKDESGKEKDKMEEGEICFYANDFESPPTKRYKFNDAFLVHFEETFFAEGTEPMKTILTISPAIQNYGVEHVKKWNLNWVAPSEDEPYQPATETPAEEKKEPKLVDYYLTDLDGNRIEEARIGDEILLNIKTKDLIGELLTVNLNDKSADFKYKGEILPNDTISNYKINSDLEKIKLEVIEQQEN